MLLCYVFLSSIFHVYNLIFYLNSIFNFSFHFLRIFTMSLTRHSVWSVFHFFCFQCDFHVHGAFFSSTYFWMFSTLLFFLLSYEQTYLSIFPCFIGDIFLHIHGNYNTMNFNNCCGTIILMWLVNILYLPFYMPLSCSTSLLFPH